MGAQGSQALHSLHLAHKFCEHTAPTTTDKTKNPVLVLKSTFPSIFFVCAWGGACNYLGSADTLKDSVLKEHSNAKRWKTTLAPSLWLLAQAYDVYHLYLLGSVVGWGGGVGCVLCVRECEGGVALHFWLVERV